MGEPTCSVTTCDRAVRTRGLCNTHYQRLKTAGDPQEDKPIRGRRPNVAPGAECAVDGCGREPDSRGWCTKHYSRWKRTGNVAGWTDPGCSISGCDRSHYGGPGKWCRVHYRRWKTHGDPLTKLVPAQRLPQPKQACAQRRCQRDAVARGLCRRHWGWEYRRANPDVMTAIRHRRRARLEAAPLNDLTAAQWRDAKAAYGHRCAYCHKRKPLTMDHVIPLSRGGAHTLSNVVPACRNCNSRKRDRPAPPFQPLLI